MNIEDQLADITADLVERDENSPFLERIFSQQAGAWEAAAALCNNVVHIKTQIEQLQKHLVLTPQCTGSTIAVDHAARVSRPRQAV